MGLLFVFVCLDVCLIFVMGSLGYMNKIWILLTVLYIIIPGGPKNCTIFNCNNYTYSQSILRIKIMAHE